MTNTHPSEPTNYLKQGQFWSAFLGNFFEHYDTAIFGFLSPFLAPLIFPMHDFMTALILTYAMIPLGMLARPIGALFFGYIGDYYGRTRALFWSLVGMSVVSGSIALSPTYEQAGILAPVIFGLGRLLQNFLAAGETIGGAIFLLENTEKKRHDFLSGIFNASTIGGILFASLGVSIISHYNILENGWRALYVIGCLTGVFGCILRINLPLNEVNIKSIKGSYSPLNLFNIFIQQWKALFVVALSSGFSYANYSIALVLMNGFIPMITTTTKNEMMNLNTFLLVFDFISLPFFGWLASKVSRVKLMLGASLGVVFMVIPLFMVLEGGSFLTVVLVRICLVLFGVAFFAPFHAWVQDFVPATHRYLIVSFGYAVGSQIFGGPTAAFSLWLFKTTGIVSSVSWYLFALALINGVILIKMNFFAIPKEERCRI